MHERYSEPAKPILYRQDQFPVLQNRVYSSVESAINCPKGDIEIVQDPLTGLIYNAAFKPELITYDTSYNNEQSVSGVFQRHLGEVEKLIERHLGKDGLVEVGCGKGYFLELLSKHGFDITGFDSTYDGDNPRIIKRYFEPGIIVSPAHGLILRHVLEHIPDPIEFLFSLRESNANQGLIYIEVPCLDWILEKHAWFDIFYEHVNYFRLDDFDRMFSQIITKGRSFGGQYIYVIADLATLRKPNMADCPPTYFPEDFLVGLGGTKLDKKEGKTCVWGGASKGVIFSLLRERAGLPVDMVVDVNPAKQGKYLPATGVRIYSPEDLYSELPQGSTIYVMNSNYLEEIVAMSNNRYQYIGIDN